MNHFTKLRLYHKAMQTKYGVLFLWTLIGFAVVFISYLFWSHCSLKQSQEQIRKDYIAHIQKADSLYIHWTEYNKAVIQNSQKVNSAMLADSIIKLTLSNRYRLSRNQYNSLISVLNSHFAKMDSLHKQYDGKLLRDSLRLNTERELLEGQTQTMLELHLNKIEHEYSNITMWGAVLTILFLVFSFYSIYKMDELIQQGNEGVKDIKDIKKEGRQNLDQLKKEKEDIVNNMQGQLSESVAVMNDIQKKTEIQFKNAAENMTSVQSGLMSNYQKALDDFRVQINVFIEKYDENLVQKQQEFDDLVTRVNDILDKLNGMDSKKED